MEKISSHKTTEIMDHMRYAHNSRLSQMPSCVKYITIYTTVNDGSVYIVVYIITVMMLPTLRIEFSLHP